MTTTPNRGYELPAGANQLKDDVLKLISALMAVDVDVQSLVGSLAGKAGLVDTALTGTPTAPTAAPGTETNQIATTSFAATAVANAIASLVASSPSTLDTLNELATALGDDPNFATTMTTALGLKANTTDLVAKQDVASRGILSGFRNKLINGAMQIRQRGSATIAAGSSAYVLDRWLVTNGTNQSVTVDQYQLSLGSGFAVGGKYVMRHTFATAPTTGTLRVEQRIEDVTSINPGDWTLTSWMSGPSGTETLAAEVVQHFGTGGTPSADVTTAATFTTGVLASPTTIYDASTNRRCWGVTVPSMAAKLLGTNGDDYLAAAIVMTPRQSGNYDMTWSSFVEGDASSDTDPFSPRSFGEEIGLCQRFYFKTFDLGTAPAYGASYNGAISAPQAIGASSGVVLCTLRYPVLMHRPPDVSLYNPVSANGSIRNDSTGSDWSATSTTHNNAGGVTIQGTTAGGSAVGNTGSIHAVADAEIY